ncbi:MAG: hypothetical protein HYY01_09535 [Chloroflexi bacterium]|nr:hypothetical protein [Chloroflexota bacterium]
MPLDGVRMHLDYAKLTGRVETVGVGGISVNYLEQALLVFREARRTTYVYRIGLEIASPSAEIMHVPSLLGRDVLNRWRMIYDPIKDRLTFEVATADEIVAVSTH